MSTDAESDDREQASNTLWMSSPEKYESNENSNMISLHPKNFSDVHLNLLKTNNPIPMLILYPYT